MADPFTGIPDRWQEIPRSQQILMILDSLKALTSGQTRRDVFFQQWYSGGGQTCGTLWFRNGLCWALVRMRGQTPTAKIDLNLKDLTEDQAAEILGILRRYESK